MPNLRSLAVRAGWQIREHKPKSFGYSVPFTLLWVFPLGCAAIYAALEPNKEFTQWLAENQYPKLGTLVFGWVVVSLVVTAFTIVLLAVSSNSELKDAKPFFEKTKPRHRAILRKYVSVGRAPAVLPRGEMSALKYIAATTPFIHLSNGSYEFNHQTRSVLGLLLKLDAIELRDWYLTATYDLTDDDDEAIETVEQNSLLPVRSESTAAIAEPNIILVENSSWSRVIRDKATGAFVESRDGDAALVAVLRNEASRDRTVEAVKGVSAKISYWNDRYEISSVAHGVWLREQYNWVNFSLGATRTLIVGLLEFASPTPEELQPNSWRVTKPQALIALDDLREGWGTIGLQPRMEHLGVSKLTIKVTLFSDDGVIGDDFVFDFSFDQEGRTKFVHV